MSSWKRVLGIVTLPFLVLSVAQLPAWASDIPKLPKDAPSLRKQTPSLFLSGTRPWVVVLCNFTNQTVEPHSVSYFERLFSDAGAGELGLLDYWHDVSYGALSMSGTVVKGWYTLPKTRDQWSALDRYHKIQSCADAAAADVNYANYWGVVAIFPEAKTSTTSELSDTATSIGVATTSLFPTPPFIAFIDDSTMNDVEIVKVTAVNGSTYTVERGQAPTSAQEHNSGAVFIVSGDLGSSAVGQAGITLGGTVFPLGLVVLPHNIDITGSAHEVGHGFGYNHSRKLSTPTEDYNDCFDIMSAYGCVQAFNGPGTDFGDFAGKGPGLNAIMLDNQGWIPAGFHLGFNNSACNQTTVALHALGDKDALSASQALEARIPAVKSFGGTTSDYYTVEYRQKLGWDLGFNSNYVLLHLHGLDGYSYWVDNAPHFGGMLPGDGFADAASKTFVLFDSFDDANHTGTVTLSGCKIDLDLAYSGATSGQFSDAVTLAADLQAAPSAGPVSGATLLFTLGTQSCSGVTDAAGHASCAIALTQHPGPYTVNVSFAATDAVNGKSAAPTAFTILREQTQTTYTGVVTGDYHDPAAVSATLVDPDGGGPVAGKTLVFTLGGVDTCSATTNALGIASCALTPTRVPSSYSLVASFAGDVDYLPSSTTVTFAVTKEQTHPAYTGAGVVFRLQPAVLRARLLEDNASPTGSGRTVTFRLGTQICGATTDATGTASCTIVVNQPTGPKSLQMSFAGDAYYVASTAFATVTVSQR